MPAKTFNNATVKTTARNAPTWLGLGRVHDMMMLARTRRDLAELDANQLRDIGITRVDAEQEAARPFWDFSQNWLTRR